MVRSSECSLTVEALERLDTGVLPHVPRQLIRSSKLPTAALPGTLVRLFTSVGSLVGLEVRALGVDFVAARVGTTMNSLVPLRLGSIVVDGVHQLVRVVWGQSGSHDVREGRVILHRRGRIGARWSKRIVMKWSGSGVARYCCCCCCCWMVSRVGHMGVQVDGDGCGLCGRVRRRRQSGKVGQLSGLMGNLVG